MSVGQWWWVVQVNTYLHIHSHWLGTQQPMSISLPRLVAKSALLPNAVNLHILGRNTAVLFTVTPLEGGLGMMALGSSSRFSGGWCYVVCNSQPLVRQFNVHGKK